MCVYLECTQSRELTALKRQASLPNDFAPYLELSLDDLQKSHDVELARRQQVQTKAQANLINITLAVTLVFGFFNLEQHAVQAITAQESWLRWAMGAAVVCLLMSGFNAVHAIRITEGADLFLQARPTADDGTRRNLKQTIIQAIKINQLVTRRMANYTTAIYVDMRNAIILLALMLLTAIFSLGT